MKRRARDQANRTSPKGEVPTRLSPTTVTRLLYTLCVELGFCLPEEAAQALIDDVPTTPRAFADAVFLAEGLPLPIKTSDLYEQVLEVVERHFSEEPAAEKAAEEPDSAPPPPPAEILFYSVHDEHGELSNFATYPIKLDGKVWPTSEHYFQAQKFKDPAERERIRRASTPLEAARLGRSRKLRLRPDWEAVKVEVMRKAVQAKFTQHADLTALLLATGDAKLVEHTPNDEFWGDAGDGSGRNMLGRILMDLRAALREEAAC
jgi:hypothetical protein